MKFSFTIATLTLAALLLIGCATPPVLPTATLIPTVEPTNTAAPTLVSAPTTASQPTTTTAPLPKPTSAQTAPSVTELTNVTWQWVSKMDAAVGLIPVTKPENYTIKFMADGTYNALVDCNRMNGTYTLNGKSLKINLGVTTRMGCPPGSLETQFTRALQAVTIAFMKDGDLYMDLFADSGTLRFSPAK